MHQLSAWGLEIVGFSSKTHTAYVVKDWIPYKVPKQLHHPNSLISIQLSAFGTRWNEGYASTGIVSEEEEQNGKVILTTGPGPDVDRKHGIPDFVSEEFSEQHRSRDSL
ncbi:hypothetical protein Trydic_g18937 [Trypoxylus dichotomus]